MDFGTHVEGRDVIYWFALLVAVNLQTSFLTPPFGFALFYPKGVAPNSVKIQNIYRGIVPFVALQVMGLISVMIWPDIALCSPRTFPDYTAADRRSRHWPPPSHATPSPH